MKMIFELIGMAEKKFILNVTKSMSFTPNLGSRSPVGTRVLLGYRVYS